MGQVKFEAMRFNKQSELNLYKKGGSLRGAFKWDVGKVKAEDKSIVPILDALAETELKGTIVVAWRKNENGQWDYCAEKEGKAKGSFGGGESAEEKATKAQAGEEEEGALRVVEN